MSKKPDGPRMTVGDAIYSNARLFSMRHEYAGTVLFLSTVQAVEDRGVRRCLARWHGRRGSVHTVCPVSIATVALGLEFLTVFNYLRTSQLLAC